MNSHMLWRSRPTSVADSSTEEVHRASSRVLPPAAVEPARSRRPTQDALAREARAYIRRNFADEELAGTSRMAQELGVTPSHLCHAYRQAFGTTIGRQVGCLRIAKAARLLETTDSAAKRIAARVGYARATYRAFLNAFHRETGMAPTDYRRLVRRTHRRLRLRDGKLVLEQRRTPAATLGGAAA